MPDRTRFDRLEGWLDWQLRLHPAAIELGLARVSRVLARTGWRRPGVPVVTVGGTNGKGSCVALLDAVLRADGRRVATFTSPHLVDYRERIRVDGAMVDEPALIGAFERTADALDDDTLTFFEFNTLAALLVFESAQPDVLLLEVGLGGRLDAVNVVDPDVAVVVSVGLDHMDYLGPDVEAIGREKAGIFRSGRPAVCGVADPPRSVRDVAREVGARLLVRGTDFDGRRVATDAWDYAWHGEVRHAALPLPALRGDVQVANAAIALAALDALGPAVAPRRESVESGLRTVRLNGRYQRVDDPRGFHWILDVAHNPAAAATLATNLAADPHTGRTLAVCGMLGDKDVAGVLAELRDVVDAWLAASAEGPRALLAEELARRAGAAGLQLEPAGTVSQAMNVAASRARPGDRIVVFGSFHTVGPALAALGLPL